MHATKAAFRCISRSGASSMRNSRRAIRWRCGSDGASPAGSGRRRRFRRWRRPSASIPTRSPRRSRASIVSVAQRQGRGFRPRRNRMGEADRAAGDRAAIRISARSSSRPSTRRPVIASSSAPRAGRAPMRRAKPCAPTAASSPGSIAPASRWPIRSAPRRSGRARRSARASPPATSAALPWPAARGRFTPEQSGDHHGVVASFAAGVLGRAGVGARASVMRRRRGAAVCCASRPTPNTATGIPRSPPTTASFWSPAR